jgi:hypothetical protein
MIECRPRGLFSWNFDLTGPIHQATVEFNWFGEQGAIDIDGVRHEVAKHGLHSGQWELVCHGIHVFSARKPSPFARTFEIRGADTSASLRAESALGRTMVLEVSGLACRISPAHPFTRKASIIGICDDFRLACFAFWLTALTWRRAASSGSGGAG